jgi:hypothetical protein
MGWRQTEYHNPKFLSFHCGSAQFFSTISTDSVALGGATAPESEQAASHTAIATTTLNLIALMAATFCIELNRKTRTGLRALTTRLR